MMDKPHTPAETLTTARNIALETGIKFVYVGNVHDLEGQTTYCPNCNTKLIKRDWHSVLSNKIVDSKCYKCKAVVPGIFN